MSMQSIGGYLQEFLLRDQTIFGLVSARIRPVVLHEKEVLPAITYQRISGERIGQLRGAASAAEPRYQIDAWAGNWSDALALGSAIRQRLEGYTGPWYDAGSPPTTSVQVAVRFETERDLFEEDILGGLCRHSADYFIFHDTQAGTL